MNFGDCELDKTKIDWFKLLKEFKRVLVSGGTMIIFYDIFKMSDIAIFAEEIKLKQSGIVVWEKTNPAPINAKVNYLSNSREYFISYDQWI